ncbi:MAG: Bax inhibitor-1/YccA family protein, partial [Burkholderiales bacterium]|nr:Bax inhibitor-1/YccA family protein [Burkholderiales bacterium]
MNPPNYGYRAGLGARSDALYDEGLRSHMLRVYNWMTSGLVLTGIVAYGIASVPAIFDLFYPVHQTAAGLFRGPSALAYLAMFAPLVFVLVMSVGVNKLSTPVVQALFWGFCVAMGASLTNIFMIYTHASIVRVFFITAATFGAMSLCGYTTRSDLTKMGSFLMMGLFGIIIASLVNMFLGSSGLQFAISVIGVLVFVGLTAYDTQRIKADYVQYVYA